jgi:enoyl-CoA hydratase/carnithine racemase
MPANKHARLVIVRIEARPAGHIAHVTVNNPEKRNALGIAGKQQLAQDKTASRQS